jgi:hypothetical protein
MNKILIVTREFALYHPGDTIKDPSIIDSIHAGIHKDCMVAIVRNSISQINKGEE